MLQYIVIMSQWYASAFLSPSFPLLYFLLPFFRLPSFSQYLGKTHNFWHGSTLILEDRAYSEGELPAKSREPPPYDGNYSDQILNPLKHVSLEASWLCRTVLPTPPLPSFLPPLLPPFPTPSLPYSLPLSLCLSLFLPGDTRCSPGTLL